MTDIQGFVLIGGKSTRMGRDKARLELDGQPVALRAAELLKPFARDITLLGSPDNFHDLGLPVLADDALDQGPMSALTTALRRTSAAWCLFLACDLPLVSPKMIQLLVERAKASSSDAVVPLLDDGWQPLCAIYRPCCHFEMGEALQTGRRSIQILLNQLDVEAITTRQLHDAGVDVTEFANVNTPEDWRRIEDIVGARKRPAPNNVE